MKLKKNDIIIFIVALCIAGLAYLLIGGSSGVKGITVVISVDGKAVNRLPLGINTTVDVKGLTGTNTVEIKDGEVRVISADCPDLICKKHKAISCEGESIICLPNRVVVEIEGGKRTEIDGVAR